jgi:hypothetical protein
MIFKTIQSLALGGVWHVYEITFNFQLGLEVFEFEKMCQNRNYMVLKIEEPNWNPHLENVLFILNVKIKTQCL